MASPAPGKVLIVEPDEPARLTLEHLMALEGYETTCVSSSLEALEAVRDQAFDIVLASVQTTLGPNGGQLVQRIRAAHPEVQSILLTGDDSGERSTIPDELEKDTSVNVIRRSMGPDYLAAFTKNAIEYKRLMSALDRLSESGKIKLARRKKP